MTIPVIVIAIAGLATTIWLFRRSPDRTAYRFVPALLAISMAALCVRVLLMILQQATNEWTEAKLAPVVAMTKGYQLYQDPVNGVMTGWLYGPVAAIVLLPAALARDPTTAGIIGSVITCAFLLVPAAWLLLAASRGRGGLLLVVAPVFFAWEMSCTDDLARCAFVASPDGPALGLAACAAAFIYHRRSVPGMFLSALAAVLCIWTKQNLLPVVVGLLAYIALVDGLRTAGLYTAMLAGIGGILSVPLLWWFGASNMLFHMLTMPASQPFQDREFGLLWVWYAGVHDLFHLTVGNLALLFLVLVVDGLIRPASPDARTLRQWFVRRPWSIILMMAAFSPAASLPGYLKIGGFLNSLGVTNYFLLLAALAGVLDICSDVADRSGQVMRQLATAALLVGGVVTGSAALLDEKSGLGKTWHILAHPYRNTQQSIFVYAKAHPGSVFCPWNPLTTLLVDGKLYHFEWGFLDRKYANRLPPPEVVIRNMPATDMIVYARQPQTTELHNAIRGFRKSIEIPELPGCIVYIDKPE